MKYTINVVLIIFISLILPFILFKDVYARTVFFDDFKSNNLDKWIIDNGNISDFSSWFLFDGVLHGKVSSKQFSYIYINSSKLFSNYTFYAKAVNISGVDQQFVFRVSQDNKDYYLVDYRYKDFNWSQDNNNIKVYRISEDGYKLLGMYPDVNHPSDFDLTQNVYHVLKVSLLNNNIKVYFDDLLCVDAVDNSNDVLYGGKIGLMNWGGDFYSFSENLYKEIRVDENGGNKIIVIPGLGASWNAQAILLGDTSPSNTWTMTPFVKNYDLLINGLETNGLVKNKDFYVWNYDWRKPLSEIVNDFNIFVNGLNLQSGEKIDLVGHSLGGLLARIWTQDHPDLVDQTITLGSPQYGSVKAYEAWNGAKISDNFDIASIALNVLLQLKKKNNNTKIETLRNFAPIVFDLSPTFSFLKKNGALVTTKSSQFLNNENNLVSLVKNKLITVDGVGTTTKEWINLSDRSVIDKVLGIWEEGKPNSYQFGIGDGTVLKKSALISDTVSAEFISTHGDLVNKSVNFILNKLNLGTTMNTLSNNLPNKQAIFYLGSPATMTVNCGGFEKNDNEGWVVMENQDSKNCTIKLTGKDGGGTYHLVIGDEDNWKYIEGEIAEAQQLNLVISNEDIYWQMLKRNFQALGIDTLTIDNKDILATIETYINFRALNKNYKFSEGIIDNLKYILSKKSFNSTEINSMYSKMVSTKSIVDTNLRLMARNGSTVKYSTAFTYDQADKLVSEGKKYAANYLANKLFGIVWK